MGEPSYQKGDRVSVTAFGFHGWQKGVGATVEAVYDDGTLGLSVDDHGPYLTTSKKIRDVAPVRGDGESEVEPKPQRTQTQGEYERSIEVRCKLGAAISKALNNMEGSPRMNGTVKNVDGRDFAVIATPFVYPDGDHMMFYVEPQPDGGAGWRLTDAATTVGHHDILHHLGDDGLLSDIQVERVKRVLAEYGSWVEDVGFEDGELHMTVASDRIGFGIAHFMQLQVRLSAICMFGD